MRTLFCYGTTLRTHHQCMAGREDKVLLQVMSCSLAQVAAGSTWTGWFRQSRRAFRLPGRPGVLSSVPRCSASCMVATWLTSRWFRLAPARRRRSRHSGGVGPISPQRRSRAAAGLARQCPASTWGYCFARAPLEVATHEGVAAARDESPLSRVLRSTGAEMGVAVAAA